MDGSIEGLRRVTGTGTAAGAISCLLGDIETVAQVREVARASCADRLVGDVLHAGHLLLACGKGALEHLTQVAGAAVRRVIRRRPEGDRLDSTRAHGEVLLHEELILARVDL